jgi:hypothetical protein
MLKPVCVRCNLLPCQCWLTPAVRDLFTVAPLSSTKPPLGPVWEYKLQGVISKGAIHGTTLFLEECALPSTPLLTAGPSDVP